MTDTKRLRELAEAVLNLEPDFCGGNWRTHYDYEKAANPQAIIALIDELEKTERENDILKSRASQFESTLKETIRVRDEEIERLKRVVTDVATALDNPATRPSEALIQIRDAIEKGGT